MSRECPKGGGGKGCFKCGEEGHMSRDCPQGGGDNKGCFNCGGEGHMSKDCTEPRKPKPGSEGCFKCGQEGHMSRDCPNAEAIDPNRPAPVTYTPTDKTDDEAYLFESGIAEGINFAKYKDIKVNMTGNNITDPIGSFEEAGLSETVARNVARSKYTHPTPIQKYAIPAVRAGRDVMACAQTGSGKTAAFMLPILTKILPQLEGGIPGEMPQRPLALVISPTRELTNQIFEATRKFAHSTIIKVHEAYGGVSVKHQKYQILSGTHILVATPGRLIQFLKDGTVRLDRCKFFVLDEADRMLDMGFVQDMRNIASQEYGMPEKTARQTLMFSATFPENVQQLAHEFLNNYLFIAVGIVGGANTDVAQVFISVPRYEKQEKLLELVNATPDDRTVVFVGQKRIADFIASYLSQNSIRSTSMHADRFQQEREEALSQFRTGECSVLVATQVAGRGLDIANVKHVINYDLPQCIDDYVHRIGRTGRVGNTGRATSFFDADQDGHMAKDLVRILSDAQQEVPDFLADAAESGAGGGSYGGGGRGGGMFGGQDTRSDSFSNPPMPSAGGVSAVEEEW